MTRTFKVLSLLLSYPAPEMRQAAPAMRSTLAEEALLTEDDHPGLYRLVDELGTRDPYELQERYVLLFDRTRSLSLHLFEHVHGESRDRGQAMVDLQTMYAERGLTIAVRELPDFLPLFLEFLATQPLAEARELLGQPLHVVVALRERLAKRDSDYAAVFAALEALAEGTASPEQLAEARAASDDDPTDLAALDRAWEETAVTFGPDDAPQGTCPKAEWMLEQMEAAPARPGTH